MRAVRLLLTSGVLLSLSACVDYGAEGYSATPVYGAPAWNPGAAMAIRSVDDFYAPLAQYGRWVESRWGRSWLPAVGAGWRPYTVGQWVNDPAYGWTWASEEPWGWATYHYGRWGYDPSFGWVWVPDTEWAPAWVAWRDGDDVTGWAPLPPRVIVSFGVGVGYGGWNDWDYDRWYGPSWVFVPRQQFGGSRQRYSYLSPDRGRDYWQHSRNATRYDRDGDRIVNNSLGRDNFRPRPPGTPGAYVPNQSPEYQGHGGRNGYQGQNTGQYQGQNPHQYQGQNSGRPGYGQTAPGAGVGQQPVPPGWTGHPPADQAGYGRPPGYDANNGNVPPAWAGRPPTGDTGHGRPEGNATGTTPPAWAGRPAPQVGYTGGQQRDSRPVAGGGETVNMRPVAQPYVAPVYAAPQQTYAPPPAMASAPAAAPAPAPRNERSQREPMERKPDPQ